MSTLKALLQSKYDEKRIEATADHNIFVKIHELNDAGTTTVTPEEVYKALKKQVITIEEIKAAVPELNTLDCCYWQDQWQMYEFYKEYLQ